MIGWPGLHHWPIIFEVLPMYGINPNANVCPPDLERSTRIFQVFMQKQRFASEML